jgi:hypothetical protein
MVILKRPCPRRSVISDLSVPLTVTSGLTCLLNAVQGGHVTGTSGAVTLGGTLPGGALCRFRQARADPLHERPREDMG